MGFFDVPEREPGDDLDDEEEDAFDDARPAAWVGGVVPLQLVVARSGDAAVVLYRIVAFPEGFELTLNTYVHRSVPRRRANLLHHPHWHDDERPRDQLLRFGLSWPDGGRATNMDGWGRSWPDATEPAHGLDEHGGSGSDREYSLEYWAWPLPGPGELRFVAEWPAFGIPETAKAVDAELLITAAASARPVWPQDAGRASHLSRAWIVSVMRRGHGTE